MNDDGFTLPEMLVALVLAGLAATALATTARMAARGEDRIRAAHTTSVSLERLGFAAREALRTSGPFATADSAGPRFAGGAQEAAFDCGAARCAIEADGAGVAFAKDGVRRTYRTPTLKAVRLGYISATDGRLTTQWPPADRADQLAAVTLMDRAQPIALLTVGREQAAACVFDLETKGCVPQAQR